MMKRFTKHRYVYFIRGVDDPQGRIKIGCSYKPSTRLTQIGAWAMYELELLATAPGNFDTEREIHDYFAADKLHREWFRSSPELLAVIDMMSRGVSFADATASLHMARAA